MVVDDVGDLHALLVVLTIERNDVIDVCQTPRRRCDDLVGHIGNGDLTQHVGSLVNQLIVDVLLHRLISEQLGVGEDLPCAVSTGTPELVLQLELEEPLAVMRVELREAVRRVQGKDPIPTFSYGLAPVVYWRWLIGDLHEHIT